MSRSLSYIFIAIVSLLFITRSSGMSSDDAALSGKLYHADHYPDHEDSRIKYSSSDQGKTFSFCRLGRNPQSPHVLKEKQYFSTGSFADPILLATVSVTFLHVFQSYNTHIPDRLKSLLYPKHSFW